MFDESEKIKQIVDRLTVIPVLIYLGIAIILALIAAVSLYHAVEILFGVIIQEDYETGIQLVFVAVFHTITAIVLFETTIVFFRTKHLAVQTLLAAGLTETIRHILVFDVGTMSAGHLLSLGIVIGILVGGIYLMRQRSDWVNEGEGTPV